MEIPVEIVSKGEYMRGCIGHFRFNLSARADFCADRRDPGLRRGDRRAWYLQSNGAQQLHAIRIEDASLSGRARS